MKHLSWVRLACCGCALALAAGLIGFQTRQGYHLLRKVPAKPGWTARASVPTIPAQRAEKQQEFGPNSGHTHPDKFASQASNLSAE